MPAVPELQTRFTWKLSEFNEAHRYTCAWCCHLVASKVGVFARGGYRGDRGPGQPFIAHLWGTIAVCPDCSRPTYFEKNSSGTLLQIPDAPLGLTVQHLPPEIAALYEEARHCTAVRAFSAAVLLCRKILLHVAVAQGSASNINFLQAVDYLAAEGIIPRNGRGWVDRIRKLGNEANHEIVLMTREQAEEALTFTGWLLMLTYHLPGSLPPAVPPTP